ncbi:MAG: FAD-binding oxidoreductase [Solirubrobacteraceae bacterium]
MSLRSLAATLDGELLEPGDAGYDAARTVWNAMIDHRPRAIARCASAADVAAAVRAGRAAGLELGVRCGGHGVLGLAVPEDGLMLDLTPLCAVRVDAAARRAWVGGGALLGALDRAAQAHGLATTAGNVSHTGVGGLTLGGGMGWLAREHGLTCDNVIAFELVTAEGEQVRADAEHNEELFWGLQGGGGNFGVVTGFEFRLHPVGTEALVVELYFTPDDAPAVLQGWRELSASAPRAATFTAWVGEAGAPFIPAGVRGRPLVSAGFVWIGDPDAGLRLLPALRALGEPVAERIEAMSYLRLQRMDDTLEGHALRRYWKGHYLAELPDAAIAAYVTRGAQDGDRLPSCSLQAYGGAIAERPDADAAFSQRTTQFEFVASARWEDPDEDGARMAAARRTAAALDPFASGAYVNVISDEGAAGVARAYSPAKLARLTALKDAWDPDNVFHRNQNIPPSR